jgi:hypothetical protein
MELATFVVHQFVGLPLMQMAALRRGLSDAADSEGDGSN